MRTKTIFTVEDLTRVHDEGARHELDEGELLAIPFGSEEHGDIGAEIISMVGNFVKEHRLKIPFARPMPRSFAKSAWAPGTGRAISKVRPTWLSKSFRHPIPFPS